MIERVLRLTALLIGLLAFLDPAITSDRAGKPDVALVSSFSDARGHDELMIRTERALAKNFAVLRAPFARAAATVVVGDRLPSRTGTLALPLFAVLPDQMDAVVRIEAVRAPRTSSSESRLPIAVVLHTRARGRVLTVTLRQGALVVDRVVDTLTTTNSTREVVLSYMPTAVGTTVLSVVADVGDTLHMATTSVVVDIRDTRWSVLAVDARPSWTSTFVRRAIARDRRFAVSSRVVTSRNISTDAGNPPRAFDDIAALLRFDAIVIGAPESLSARDIQGLERYLRQRGGSVVLLFDHNTLGAYSTLLGNIEWSKSSSATSLPVVRSRRTVGGDTSGLRVTEFMSPMQLPEGSRSIADVRTGADSGVLRALVWRTAVGAGRILVSGALDAWRFRDPLVSGFDRFWQSVVAEAADASPSAIEIRTVTRSTTPNEWIDLSVTLREAALSDAAVWSHSALPSSRAFARASVSAHITSHAFPRVAVRLWPDGSIGGFRGSFRAPGVVGHYYIAVTAGDLLDSVPIVVARAPAVASAEQRELLRSMAIAGGGFAVDVAQLDSVSSAILSAAVPATRAETWHPMRSAWWLVPFALLLSAEWWLRRRRGLA